MATLHAMGAPRQDRAAQVASHQTRLQKIVLAWDYLRIVTDSKVCIHALHALQLSPAVTAVPSLRTMDCVDFVSFL